MRMTARLSLACLLLLVVPLAGVQALGAAEEEAPGPAAEREAATTAAAAAASAAVAAEEAGESDAAAAGGEIEATFSPTERVPADASIRFPVDI